MGCHTNSLPLLKQLDPNESIKIIQNVKGTDSPELNEYSYYGSFTYSEKLSFQIEIEMKQVPFTPIKLNTVGNGVFTYQPNIYD